MARKALVTLAVLGACGVQTVQRAATVPHATPLLHTAPMPAAVDIEIGLSSVAHTTLAARDPDAAVEIPGTQGEGALRIRLGDDASVSVIAADGLATGARAIDRGQLPVGRGVFGGGLGVAGGGTAGRWRFAGAAELMLWNVPVSAVIVCPAPCPAPPPPGDIDDDELVGQLGVSAQLGYRGRWWTVAGGLASRTHPTVSALGAMREGSLGQVSPGGPAGIASLGLAIDLGGGLRVDVALYQVVAGGPARYGPSAAVTLAVPMLPADRR